MKVGHFLDIGREVETQRGRSTGVGVGAFGEEIEREFALIDLDEIGPALGLTEPSFPGVGLPFLSLLLQTT